MNTVYKQDKGLILQVFSPHQQLFVDFSFALSLVVVYLFNLTNG